MVVSGVSLHARAVGGRMWTTVCGLISLGAEERRMKNKEYIVWRDDIGEGLERIVFRGELIRCKDCKHYNGLLYTLCPRSGMNVIDDDEDYCCRAERKEE